MKMKNLLLGVILGLLAVVHTTPIDNVNQIPTKAEDDVLQEAMMDEFLILPTTESPKRNTTIQESQQPFSDSKKSDLIEGSATGDNSDYSMTFMLLHHGGEHYATHVSHAQSSTSTVLPRNTDDYTSDSSTTQSTQSSFTSSSMPQSSVTPDHISAFQTIDPAVNSFDSSDLGSGDEEMLEQNPDTSSSMTSSSNTETSTASSTSMAVPQIFEESEGPEIPVSSGKQRSLQNLPPNNEPVNPASPQNSTPGWIIVVGFIAGVAALVILSVAIATRDKWYGPNQASQLETKTNSSNQQREQEMETFLHKDNPRENGKAAEYTVIALDELPQKYSSH